MPRTVHRIARFVVGLAVTFATAATSVAGAFPASAMWGPGEPIVDTPLPAHGQLVAVTPTRVFTDLTLLASDNSELHFVTVDSMNKPVEVTALLARSRQPWTGPGERPLVVISPGTMGMTPDCAFSKAAQTFITVNPSRPWSFAISYDFIRVATFLHHGVDVVVPDYPGMGSPGLHPYMDNVATGRSSVDAALAAQQALGRSTQRVAFVGYSQGGSTAAWVAENGHRYAPTIDIAGVSIGAPPNDYYQAAHDNAHHITSGLMFMAMASMMDRYPDVNEAVNAVLTPRGKELIALSRKSCVGYQLPFAAFQSFSQVTTTKESFADLVARIATLQKEINRQRFGTKRPPMPVQVTWHESDNLVSGPKTSLLAKSWRALGADVKEESQPASTIVYATRTGHLIDMLAALPAVSDWTLARLKDSGRNRTF